MRSRSLVPSFTRRQWLGLTGAASAAILAGCGFRLRGSNLKYPFQSLYISGGTAATTNRIKRLMAGYVQVMNTAANADVVMTILEDRQERIASAISAGAQVREVELLHLFSFNLADANGNILIDATPIRIHRFISYSENEAVAKESEFESLFNDMRNDLAWQILHRLATVQPISR